ncbi:MAG TPA: acyltransferase [Verrucomicrobiae bacterium]|jgi:peptidoglycan/LPS O-acetylase OafA/YrhL
MIESSKPHKHWLDNWHVNPSVNRDYDFIDGLRGVAILMVLFCHHFYINPAAGPALQFVGAFSTACGNGVQLFFALSGFLISWPFWKRKFLGETRTLPPGYARRRFWKIYPPLALSVLVLTPVYVILKHDASYFLIAAQWLAGLSFLLPVSGKLNPVMWTLVVEVQFYAVLPLFFLALKRTSYRASLWIMTAVFLLAPIFTRILTGQTATFQPDINAHFPTALDAFALGILLAGLENMRMIKKNWARLGMIGIILWPLTLLIIAWLRTHPEHGNVFIGESIGWMEKIASACLLCFVANPQHPIARLLCMPWLRWCGIISYEWYLFHQPITLWARGVFGPASGNFLKFALIVGGSFLFSTTVAALVYRYFSLPILKLGRKNK